MRALIVGSFIHGVKKMCSRKRKLVQSPFITIDVKKKTTKKLDLEKEPMVENKELESIYV